MNDPIVLDPIFRTIGMASFAASLIALICSAAHTMFYFRQRKRQSDEFMRGLACRMKALFLVMSVILLTEVVTSYGLMANFTMGTWYWLRVVKTVACIAYVAALFWLYAFYRRADV